MKEIIKKLEANQETVGVIGLGYVGLPLALSFSEANLNVIGFDVSEEKVAKINSGKNYIRDIRDKTLKDSVASNKLRATSDFRLISECDAIIICVPTPLDRFKKPDMNFIKEASILIGKNLKKGTFVCLESTTYPSTTEDFILPIIEENSQLKHGKDFWLAYSPERVDPGNENFNTKNTPKVLGALNQDGLIIGEMLYKKAIKNIHLVNSPRVAEMVKILENTYRLVNISLINELALLCGKMEIDIWEVIEAAKTKPFGFQAFYPGPGIGGHCIPLDPFYLEHIAKKYDFDLSMIATAGHINMRMPHYMFIKISTALNSIQKSVNGSKILIVGVAYKPEIDDERESPALKIIEKLLSKGAEVDFYDPYINEICVGDRILQTIQLNDEILRTYDAVAVCTKHKIIDYTNIKNNSHLVVDFVNAIEKGQNIFKL